MTTSLRSRLWKYHFTLVIFLIRVKSDFASEEYPTSLHQQTRSVILPPPGSRPKIKNIQNDFDFYDYADFDLYYVLPVNHIRKSPSWTPVASENSQTQRQPCDHETHTNQVEQPVIIPSRLTYSYDYYDPGPPGWSWPAPAAPPAPEPPGWAWPAPAAPPAPEPPGWAWPAPAAPPAPEPPGWAWPAPAAPPAPEPPGWAWPAPAPPPPPPPPPAPTPGWAWPAPAPAPPPAPGWGWGAPPAPKPEKEKEKEKPIKEKSKSKNKGKAKDKSKAKVKEKVIIVKEKEKEPKEKVIVIKEKAKPVKEKEVVEKIKYVYVKEKEDKHKEKDKGKDKHKDKDDKGKKETKPKFATFVKDVWNKFVDILKFEHAKHADFEFAGERRLLRTDYVSKNDTEKGKSVFDTLYIPVSIALQWASAYPKVANVTK